jgi:hypothetical protein
VTPALKDCRRLVLWLALVLTFSLCGCGPAPEPPPAVVNLTGEDFLAMWTPAGIPGEGECGARDGVLYVGAGQPMSGVRFDGDWEELRLPVTDYDLEFESRRVDGEDFFATCTFPVGALDRCVSLVLGGWGGGLVGISSIDHYDASQNQTRSEKAFENGVWYRVRIAVRDDEIAVWIDGRPVARVATRGRHLGLRPGDIDHCAPLGFASWATDGEVRAVMMRRWH